MQAIGIRDLKARGSEILRRVREEGTAFEVTYHGRVIARLVPTIQPQPQITAERFLERWDQLSRRISEHWPEGYSAVDAVREQRRDL